MDDRLAVSRCSVVRVVSIGCDFLESGTFEHHEGFVAKVPPQEVRMRLRPNERTVDIEVIPSLGQQHLLKEIHGF